MVNSPRAGSLVELESPDAVCAIRAEENSPIAPSAAAPPMKPRLQISHIAPPDGSARRRPPLADFICDWVCPLAALLHQMATVTSGLHRAKPALVPCSAGAGAGQLPQSSCRDPPYFVTELIRLDVRWIKYGAVDETGIEHAITFTGLVQSRVLVVGDADAGQRRQYRGLDSDVPRASPCRQFGPYSRHGGHASAKRGLCVWLRLPLAVAARRCAADF